MAANGIAKNDIRLAYLIGREDAGRNEYFNCWAACGTPDADTAYRNGWSEKVSELKAINNWPPKMPLVEPTAESKAFEAAFDESPAPDMRFEGFDPEAWECRS